MTITFVTEFNLKITKKLQNNVKKCKKTEHCLKLCYVF